MSYGKQSEKELIVRYAKALFALAKEKNQLEIIERDALSLQSLLEASKELRKFIKNPLVSRKEQESSIQNIAKSNGLSAIVEKFCRVLAKNRRLNLLEEVLREFHQLLSRYRGEVKVEVTAAVPLKEDQIASIKEELARVLGKKIRLETKTNASLLGGMIVKVGSKMLDNTLSSQLDALRVVSKKAVSTFL